MPIDWEMEKLNVHRISFMIFSETLDIGKLKISHLCYNTLCIWPSHLSMEPHAVNSDRVRHVNREVCKGHAGYQDCLLVCKMLKEVREKSRECHNHKPQPFPDTKRKRKPTNPNKHKSNKRTKSTKNSSLFPKRGNCNAKRTKKHKNKMIQGKT